MIAATPRLDRYRSPGWASFSFACQELAVFSVRDCQGIAAAWPRPGRRDLDDRQHRWANGQRRKQPQRHTQYRPRRRSGRNAAHNAIANVDPCPAEQGPGPGSRPGSQAFSDGRSGVVSFDVRKERTTVAATGGGSTPLYLSERPQEAARFDDRKQKKNWNRNRKYRIRNWESTARTRPSVTD